MRFLSQQKNLEISKDLKGSVKQDEYFFKKISIIPKGQSPELKGELCNVQIDVVDVYKTLPHLVDSNGIVIVKLKRKLQYRGHVYFESLRPTLL